MKKIIVGFLGLVAVGVIGFLLIQLIPYGHNHANPPVIQEPNWDSARTRQLAQRACFDCHSNESTWPWYSNIAPISWLVQHDVDEGRRTLNFSDWRVTRRTGEISRVVLGGEMPPATYLLTHPQAKLSATEKQELASGLTATASR
jgi:mono/diheme cytochrome c family protein